jgi:hypothetical protein
LARLSELNEEYERIYLPVSDVVGMWMMVKKKAGHSPSERKGEPGGRERKEGGTSQDVRKKWRAHA